MPNLETQINNQQHLKSTHSPPFNNENQPSKYELGPKEEQKEEVVMDYRKDYSDDFKSLVLSMMSYHNSDRPSIETIRNHPWLKGEVPS